MEHELNGEYDCCVLQCLELGETQDRWRVTMNYFNASGILTIFHAPDEDGQKQYNGWDWEGSPALVNDDQTMTDALQDVMDCLDDEYTT